MAAGKSPAMAGATESRILEVIRAIPRGRVSTYGQVAEAAGLGRGARVVGHALRHLPKGTKTPWHRVINASGRISFPSGSAGYREQKRRLESEGVTFLAGRIDLKQFGLQRTLDELLWKPGK